MLSLHNPHKDTIVCKKFVCICKYFFSDKAFFFLIQEKDKKKGKGQATANTVQTMAEAKMASASMVASNKLRSTENVTALKSEIKKDTRKSSLPGAKANYRPRTLPPIEKQQKNAPSSKGTVPRRKITPQGPPKVSKIHKRKLR